MPVRQYAWWIRRADAQDVRPGLRPCGARHRPVADAGGLDDQIVELRVDLVEFDAADAVGRFHRLDHAVEHLELRRRDVTCGQACSSAFDSRAAFKNRMHPQMIHALHFPAPPAHDQAFSLQQQQRLAHRRAADLKHVAQFFFDQPLTRFEIGGEDHATDFRLHIGGDQGQVLLHCSSLLKSVCLPGREQAPGQDQAHAGDAGIPIQSLTADQHRVLVATVHGPAIYVEIALAAATRAAPNSLSILSIVHREVGTAMVSAPTGLPISTIGAEIVASPIYDSS
jgi:hypothetical protein